MAQITQDEQSQIESFSRWANFHLQKRGLSCTNIIEDFKDGLSLVALGEELLGQPFQASPGQKLVQQPKSDFHRLANVSIALKFLRSNGVKLHGVDANDVVRGNVKFVLSLVWALARYAHLRLLGPSIRSLTDKSKVKPATTPPTSDNPPSLSFLQSAPETSEGQMPYAATPPPIPPKSQGSEAQEEYQLTNLLTDFLMRSSRSAQNAPESFGASGAAGLGPSQILSILGNGNILPEAVGYLIQLDRGNYPMSLSEAYLAHLPPGQRNEAALQQASEELRLPMLFSGQEIADGKVSTQSILLYLTLLHSTEQSILQTGGHRASEDKVSSSIPSKGEQNEPMNSTDFTVARDPSSAAVPFAQPPPLPPRPHASTGYQSNMNQRYQMESYSSASEPVRAGTQSSTAEYTTSTEFSSYSYHQHPGLNTNSQSMGGPGQSFYQSQSASTYPASSSVIPTLSVPSPSPAPFESIVTPQSLYASSYNPSTHPSYPSYVNTPETTMTQQGQTQGGPAFASYSATTSFPNEPIGGQMVNGLYVTSTAQLHYNPGGASTSTVSTTSSTATKKKGIIGSSMAFAKRLAKEASHEFDKVYAVIDDSSSVQRFQKYFRFKYFEPFYGEHAVKFFTTASGGESVMMIGFAYVTENYFCFTGERASGRGTSDRVSAILSLLDVIHCEGGITPFLDRYKDVPRVTPARMAPNQSPNAAILTDRFGKVHEFYSILSCKQFLNQFHLKWQQALVRRQQAIPLHPPPFYG